MKLRDLLESSGSSKIPSLRQAWKHAMTDPEMFYDELEERLEDSYWQEEYEEATGQDPDDHYDEYKQWFIDTIVKQEHRERYENVRSVLDNTEFYCYRAMNLPKDVKAEDLAELGIYWTTNHKAAQAYDDFAETRGVPHLFKAKISRSSVDAWSTVMARCHLHHGDEEEEITVIKGAPIFLIDADHVEVNEWRKA